MPYKEAFMANNPIWLNKLRLLRWVFTIIILYSISSVNVLILALSILPHLPNAALKPHAIVGFALISLVLAILTGLYHLYTMFRKKNTRKADMLPEANAANNQPAGEMSFSETWKLVNPASKKIFAILVVYAAACIFILLFALDVVLFIPDPHRRVFVYMGFAMLSFAVTVINCVYQLTNYYRRRKRASDKQADNERRQSIAAQNQQINA
jgi:cbb3-type cytochrome oxidase subunit 3